MGSLAPPPEPPTPLSWPVPAPSSQAVRPSNRVRHAALTQPIVFGHLVIEFQTLRYCDVIVPTACRLEQRLVGVRFVEARWIPIERAPSPTLGQCKQHVV